MILRPYPHTSIYSTGNLKYQNETMRPKSETSKPQHKKINHSPHHILRMKWVVSLAIGMRDGRNGLKSLHCCSLFFVQWGNTLQFWYNKCYSNSYANLLRSRHSCFRMKTMSAHSCQLFTGCWLVWTIMVWLQMHNLKPGQMNSWISCSCVISWSHESGCLTR